MLADKLGPFSSLSQGANGALDSRVIERGIAPSPVVTNGAQITSYSSLGDNTNPGAIEDGLDLSPRPHNLDIRWRAKTVRPKPAMNRA